MKEIELTAKSAKSAQSLHSKIDISRQRMDQLVGFMLRPPLSEIAKKLGKMLKYTPTFKVLSASLLTQPGNIARALYDN